MSRIETQLIPLTSWSLYHPWPTRAGLRHLVANAKKKRFEKVFVKAGGRILIDESAFLTWARQGGHLDGTS
jgi:hypothetical protein